MYQQKHSDWTFTTTFTTIMSTCCIILGILVTMLNRLSLLSAATSCSASLKIPCQKTHFTSSIIHRYGCNIKLKQDLMKPRVMKPLDGDSSLEEEHGALETSTPERKTVSRSFFFFFTSCHISRSVLSKVVLNLR